MFAEIDDINKLGDDWLARLAEQRATAHVLVDGQHDPMSGEITKVVEGWLTVVQRVPDRSEGTLRFVRLDRAISVDVPFSEGDSAD